MTMIRKTLGIYYIIATILLAIFIYMKYSGVVVSGCWKDHRLSNETLEYNTQYNCSITIKIPRGYND